jgi:N-acetylneuraminate synthase
MLAEESRRGWQALGEVAYGPTQRELASLKHRRSLYVSRDIKKGELISKENIKAIRPGLGLPTKYQDQFLGHRAARDAAKGTPVDWTLLLNE